MIYSGKKFMIYYIVSILVSILVSYNMIKKDDGTRRGF